MNDPNTQLGLGLNIDDPPLLVLLRKLCAGEGCHPCPGGVSEGYLSFAAGGDVGEDLRKLWRAGKVTRIVEEDDTAGALWKPGR